MLPSGTPEYNHQCQAEHEQLNPRARERGAKGVSTSAPAWDTSTTGQRTDSKSALLLTPQKNDAQATRGHLEENKDRKYAITERKDQNISMKRNRERKSRKEKKGKPSKKHT